MDMNEATSKAIAAERAAAHMTVKELAEKSGVPERTLIRLLKNERKINVIQVAQIASAIGIYPHELIEEAERYIKRNQRHDPDSSSVGDGEVVDVVNQIELGLAAYKGDHKFDDDADQPA